MEQLLKNKIILVTGASQGLGLAIAEAAGREGAEGIAIVGRNPEKTQAVAQRLLDAGYAAHAIIADLGAPGEAKKVVAETIKVYGRIDSLVNAAGATSRGTLLDTSPELLNEHLAVNLIAPFFTMQAAVANMVERKSPGTIVNIISMSAHGGQPYLTPYVASKAGLAGLTKNVAHAHRFDRVRVNGLNIGWTATPGEAKTQKTFHSADDNWLAEAEAKQPMGKLGQPDEIADAVVFLLSERSGVVTGSVIDWDQMVLGGHD